MSLNTAESGSLSAQVILVTGAAGGIGSEVAKAYARQGATVILLDKQLKKLEHLYDQIVAEGAQEPFIYPLDLKGASSADYAELAARIHSELGRLDGLVHCAASLGQLAPVVNQTLSLWLETLHINLTATYLLTQSCLSLLQQQPYSFVIFTTDSNQNKAYWGAYGVSKAGLEVLCQQMACELAAEDRVKVYCLDPGPVQTPLHKLAYPALDPKNLPLPDAVVPAYLYLASPNSNHLHGQCIKACQPFDTAV